MKKIIAAIAVCSIIAVLLLPARVSAQSDSIVTTNITGTTTLSPTNSVPLFGTLPSGLVVVEKRFKVTSGTITVVNATIAASTNVLSNAGATFAVADGWQTLSNSKLDNTSPPAFSRTGTITGAATVDWWIRARR